MSSLLEESSLLNEQDREVAVGSAPSTESNTSASQWWKSDRAKIAYAVVMLLIAAVMLYSTMGKSDPAAITKSRRGIDQETSKVFMIPIVDGESAPWKNPDTGKRTLYPAEACYWTKDGKATLTPTYVFVKSYIGIKEKTYCPDCGHEVRPHNPMPPDKLMEEAATNGGGK